MRPTLRAEGGMGRPKELGIDVGQGAGGDGGRCEVPEGMLAGRGEACLDAEVVSKEFVHGAVVVAEVPKGVFRVGGKVFGEEEGSVLREIFVFHVGVCSG